MICYQIQSGELDGFTDAPTATEGLCQLLREQKIATHELSILLRFRKVNKYRQSFRIMGPWFYVDPCVVLKGKIKWRG
jgi:hypothetical protein